MTRFDRFSNTGPLKLLPDKKEAGIGSSRSRSESAGSTSVSIAPSPRSTPIKGLGAIAFEILSQSPSPATRLADFPAAPFIEIDGELLWIGSGAHGWHPRAVLVSDDLAQVHTLPAFVIHLNSIAQRQVWLEGMQPWASRTAGNLLASVPALSEAPTSVAALLALLSALTPGTIRPRGLGALLTGERLSAPLDLAHARIQVLIDALSRNDAATALEHALPLLGLGAGLTPSCDDFIGAAWLAKLLSPGLPNAQRAAWQTSAQTLAHVATERTHRISATLLADTLRGESYGVLTSFARACLDSSVADTERLDAARQLVAVGHSSGWDLLTGFVLGLHGNALCSANPPIR